MVHARDVLETMSKPINSNPILATINGIGFAFAGVALRHPDLGDEVFVRTHWFKFVYVPVFPVGIYLLSKPLDEEGKVIDDGYHVHRAVQVRGVRAIWGKGAFSKMLWSAWGIALGIIAVIAVLVSVLFHYT